MSVYVHSAEPIELLAVQEPISIPVGRVQELLDMSVNIAQNLLTCWQCRNLLVYLLTRVGTS